jgi:hypothetical protein
LDKFLEASNFETEGKGGNGKEGRRDGKGISLPEK